MHIHEANQSCAHDCLFTLGKGTESHHCFSRFDNFCFFLAGLVMEALSDGGVLGGENQIIGLIVSI